MKTIGFMGLGLMGLPMAVNIAKSGFKLAVFNRTPGKADPALEVGAVEADSPSVLFKWSDIIVMMLSGPNAVEAILHPVWSQPSDVLCGKILVNMGTNPPIYSRELASRLEERGVLFVDAPVSGTNVLAETGSLLVLSSGSKAALEEVDPIFQVVGNTVVYCGNVPNAANMKLANNIVLSASLSGLAEGIHFARKAGLDLETFFRLIADGPMGNQVFNIKAKKIMEEDFSPQASIATVREMLKHITDTAYELNAFLPNTLSNVNLITSALNLGLGGEDACAILKVFEQSNPTRLSI